MRSRLLAVCLVAIGVTGCGALRGSFDLIAQEPTPIAITTVAAPDETLADAAVVTQAARSVVRIHTEALQCARTVDGSGVVVAPNRVMSAAHAVAGADSVSVFLGDREIPATVVIYDPAMDVAVLDVPDLHAPTLPLDQHPAVTGTDVMVLGYPGGGPFVATPARIRRVMELLVPDIYRTTTVNREVYVIRGPIRHGGSGGPLIDLNGRVLGITFGAAIDDPETGFVLTAKQVSTLVMDGARARTPVATGACTP
ncbi:MarP family serine protease [Mycobacterium sp. 1164985.4]|uniref:MarP family serine protease n=1 Tax=Mycobacterium sp. 1164985.4 TaxID=1834069 RepID=UPI0009EE8E4E|nr:MarP family serine protease [Mycobacterium sp. 1164985.4]